jgi:hypothetical protein
MKLAILTAYLFLSEARQQGYLWDSYPTCSFHEQSNDSNYSTHETDDPYESTYNWVFFNQLNKSCEVISINVFPAKICLVI